MKQKRLDSPLVLCVSSTAQSRRRRTMRRPNGSMEGKEGQPGKKSFLVALGRKIQRHRKSRGWSRGQLARKLGVTENCLGRWERAERLPRPPTLNRVMAVCGVMLK